MSKEEDNLNMDLFSEEPVIDLTTSEDLEYLFAEENQEGEDSLENQEQEEENENNNDNNDTDENENSEDVVGTNKDNVEEETSDEQDDAETSSSNPNLFSSLAALLSDKGLLSSTESTIENEDDFIEMFKKEIKSSEYSDLNTNQKEYLDKIREGIPQQKVEQDQYNTSRLDNITEDSIKEDSDLRQRIIYQDFVNRGFTDAKARKLLQRSIELDADLEDANDALESIKEFSKTKIDKENEQIKLDNAKRETKEANRIESVKTKIQKTDEVISGFKITSAVKEKIEQNMFDVVGENPDTKQNENALLKYRRENPEDFDHKLYYLFTITNGFQNFESLLKNTKSRAIKDLERVVASNTRIKDQGSPAYLQDPNSYSVDVSGHDLVVE